MSVDEELRAIRYDAMSANSPMLKAGRNWSFALTKSRRISSGMNRNLLNAFFKHRTNAEQADSTYHTHHSSHN